MPLGSVGERWLSAHVTRCIGHSYLHMPLGSVGRAADTYGGLCVAHVYVLSGGSGKQLLDMPLGSVKRGYLQMPRRSLRATAVACTSLWSASGELLGH